MKIFFCHGFARGHANKVGWWFLIPQFIHDRPHSFGCGIRITIALFTGHIQFYMALDLTSGFR